MKRLTRLGAKLTAKQRSFCEIYVANYPDMTKTQAAEQAGYSKAIASKTGSNLTNPDLNPAVVSYMEILRDQKSGYFKDYLRHLKRLDILSKKAENKGQYAAAVNAEFRLGQAAGFYVDRAEIKVEDLSAMSKEELIEQIKKLQDEIPQANVIEVPAEETPESKD
jgi:hypothetical protein